jgi:hypothetical protein
VFFGASGGFSTKGRVVKSAGNLSFLQLGRLQSKKMVIAISALMAGCYNPIVKGIQKGGKKALSLRNFTLDRPGFIEVSMKFVYGG